MREEKSGFSKTISFIWMDGALLTFFLFGLILSALIHLFHGHFDWFSLLIGPVQASLGLLCVQLLFSFCFRNEIKQEALQEKLLASGTGIKTTAEILSVKQTGKYVNEMPVFGLELKYSLNGQEFVKPDYRVVVDYTELDVYKKGKNLALLVDPEDFQNVVLDSGENIETPAGHASV